MNIEPPLETINNFHEILKGAFVIPLFFEYIANPEKQPLGLSKHKFVFYHLFGEEDVGCLNLIILYMDFWSNFFDSIETPFLEKKRLQIEKSLRNIFCKDIINIISPLLQQKIFSISNHLKRSNLSSNNSLPGCSIIIGLIQTGERPAFLANELEIALIFEKGVMYFKYPFVRTEVRFTQFYLRDCEFLYFFEKGVSFEYKGTFRYIINDNFSLNGCIGKRVKNSAILKIEK